MSDLLRAIEDLAAKLPPRRETLGLILIVPAWVSGRVLQIDGPHTLDSLVSALGVGGVEAWEHVRSRSEFRILVGGPALESGLLKAAALTEPGAAALLFGVPVIRLRGKLDADAWRVWAEHAWPGHRAALRGGREG